MIEFFFAFLILLLVVAGMSIGVLNNRSPISGSCGGLGNLGVDGACEICGGKPVVCEQKRRVRNAKLFFDASG